MPLGHITHLGNYTSIDKHISAWYDYTITLITREKRHYLLFENWMVFICFKFNPLHPSMLCVISLVKIGPVVLERIFTFCQWILLFRYHLPLEMVMGLVFEKIWILSPEDALWQVWLNLAFWFLTRFLNFIHVFFTISLLSLL